MSTSQYEERTISTSQWRTPEEGCPQEAEFLYPLAHDLARSVDVSTIAHIVLGWAQRLLGANYVDLMVAEPGNTKLRGWRTPSMLLPSARSALMWARKRRS